MANKNIIFIDPRVSDYQSLIDSLTDPAEVFVLDGASDGLSQMASLLEGRNGIEAIHVISHGSQGALYLGSTLLNNDDLASYQSQFTDIENALTEFGDILLYGCNVAQGDDGLRFIDTLAKYTGADVAASSNATGAATLGGDWVLERMSGRVEAPVIPVVNRISLLAVNTTPTFTGHPGKLTTAFAANPPVYDYQTNIAIQSDGKILQVGSYENSYDGSTYKVDLALARYNTDGSLDVNFGDHGKVTNDLGSVDMAQSVALQVDGKILVAGTNGLLRYNANGSIDTTFGVAGKVDGSYFSITIQGDGKILGVGDTNGKSWIARYSLDGTLDTTFGVGGTSTSDFGFSSDSAGHLLAVQADGKILLTGSSNKRPNHYDFAVARYDSNGVLDAHFGINGVVTSTISGWDFPHGITLQPNGKILVVGSTNTTEGIGLARYNTDGSPDTSFHGDGQLTTAVDLNSRGYGVALQADGKILVAGTSLEWVSSPGNWNFAIVRYNTDGSLDTSFGDDGKIVTDFGGMDFAFSIAVQSDGKVLVSGRGGDGNNFALARYNTDGSLDTTFGPAVNTLDAVSAYTENSASFALDKDVQIVDAELAGTGNYSGATLTLSRHNGANAQDVFSSTSDGTLTTLTTGSYFSVDSVTIGRVTINAAGTLTLAFNANATQSLVNKAMQQIAYANTSDAPSPTVQIDWTFNDGNTGAQGTGGAMSVTGSTTVQITVVNDAPIQTTSLADQTAIAGRAFSYAIPTGTFTDPDLETLTYSVQMADGTGVPPWLSFKTSTQTFSGTPSTSDTGSLDILVTAKDAANASVSGTLRLAVLTQNSPPTGAVSISGTPIQGETLSANTTTLADVDGLGALSYQWIRSGTAISGATDSSYILTQSDVFSTISVRVTYTDGRGANESVTSNASTRVDNVNDVPTGEVSIIGDPTQGQTLTVSNTLADIDGLGTLSYQWKADGVAISGAASSSLLLKEAQVGKAITVTARYTDGFYMAESVTSNASSLVANINDAPTGYVVITGRVVQGQTLTAINSLNDADGMGTISYQWNMGGNPIIDATESTFTLTESQVGKTINVAAIYTDGHGTVESVSSAATIAVGNINDAPTGTVTITGTPTLGQVLTASNTIADPDGLGAISYQWSAAGVAISGATSNTFTLGSAQVGKTVKVTASYTDGHGTKESLSSIPTATIIDNGIPTPILPSYTVPGTLGNDVFVLTAGNSYLGGGGNDTYIISSHTLNGAVTAKIIDTEGSNVIQLVDGLTITSSSFYSNAVQLKLSNGASVQILGAAAFSYQVGANAPAGDTASSQTYAQFASTLGASVPTGSTPVSGMANYQVPTGASAAIQMPDTSSIEASVTLVGLNDLVGALL